jgi:transposase
VNRIICGVDVSKLHLDAAIEPIGAAARFSNDAEGIAQLAAFCRAHKVALVAMEATGGYERLAFGLLWQENIACVIVNPRQVRHYAKGMGTDEKTDKIDAPLIARFADHRGLEPTPPQSQNQKRLKALVARLRQVTDDLTANKLRLQQAHDEAMHKSIAEVIALLKRQSRQLEGEIASAIDDDPLWARLEQAFRSFKGVASRGVAWIMAELPEIGTYDNKAIAKLAGLAPLADDSGKKTGKRHIRGGRSGVRSILYVIADIARRYDDKLKAFHERLTKAGKPKKVVRTAVARKLLVRLNARAREARAQYANAT